MVAEPARGSQVEDGLLKCCCVKPGKEPKEEGVVCLQAEGWKEEES